MLTMNKNRTYDVPDLTRLLQTMIKAGDRVEIYDSFEAELVYYGVDTVTGRQIWKCFIRAF